MTSPRVQRFALSALAAILIAAAPEVRVAAAPGDGQSRFLAKEDILLFGLGLHVECNDGELPDENGITACQTVPKGFATAIPTMFVAPQAPDNLPGFGPDAVILGTLRGPSFPTPIELSTKPNTPFSIPPMSVPGLHSLDDIRLVLNGQVLLRGDRESALIRVIDKLLVTSVTARPLTADEERAKGLVFDRSNFQAYNFAAAFAIADKKVPINFTVVLPTLQSANDINANKVTLPSLGSAPGLPSLQTVIPDSLKQLSLQVPNLNVVGFTLKVPETVGQNFFVPPIPGVIVIPGDIGFLDQFFSVMLMVGNVAPVGSGLVVSDLSAEIVLPPDDHNVANSPDAPLQMGRTDKGEVPRVQPVTQPGPDGKLGTSDDIKTIGPGETGSVEYLVEGKREGTHIIEMRISGTLHGLPIGPLPITGIARGAVLVRNPTFTLTFTHPEVVSAGEQYSLDVTVTNTSASPANFVSLNLYPRFVTGASIVGDSTRTIDSIAPGDSSTVSFDLLAAVSGKVTAATFEGDEQVAGRFTLKSSVGELGIPVSPDSLVLPKEAASLPPALRAAAIGLLGKAWAVATAPTAALPKDVTRFSKKIVIDRAIEVAEAGFRLSLHEPARDNAAQLLMDFMGSNFVRLDQLTAPADLEFTRADYLGFDELRRRSVRGDVFAQAVAAVLQPDLTSLGAAAFHHDLAEKIDYRPPHLSVLVTSDAGPLPVALTLLDTQGRRLGGVDAQGKVLKEIAFGDYLTFGDGGGMTAGQMAFVAAPDPGEYTIQLEKSPDAPAGATYTLSIVVPDANGALRQLVFSNVGFGQTPAAQFGAGDPYRVTIQVTANGAPQTGTPATPAVSPVADLAPSIVGVVQQTAADQVCVDPGKTVGMWRPGRVIAILFSEEVTAQSVQDKIDAGLITNYALEDNKVVGVALQPGGRIALIALRDPIGPFIPRTITINSVADLRGNAMGSDTKPIEPTVTDPGGVVAGRILRADGSPVSFASVRFFYACLTQADEIQWIGISQKSADVDGHYQWDYVVGAPRLLAVDTETGDNRDIRFNIAHNGQRLNIDLVMVGRGTVQGHTLDEAGKPLKDSKIKITSLTDQSVYGATSDVDGRFTVARVPVGNVFIEAVNVAAQAQISISDVIPFAGATIDSSLVLLRADSPQQVTIKRVTLTAHVVRADNRSTAGLPVILFYKHNSQEGVRCPGTAVDECPIALGNTDADGTFVFAGVPAGGLHVRSFDNTTLQQGDASTVVPPDTTGTLTVILGAGLATVKGIVLDPDGKGVAGARIGGGYSLAVSDATGHFTLTDVPLGSRIITAVSDELQSTASATVDVLRAGEEVLLTLVLNSLATVKGTISHLDGSPAPNVPVYLFRQFNGQVIVVGQASTDDGGDYTINAVPLGDYTMSAFTSDFSDGNIVPVAVKFNHQIVKADVTFLGGNGGAVSGTIVDSDGTTPLKGRVSISGIQPAIAGGRVAVRFDYVQNYRIVDTGLDGVFSLGGLWPGEFTVRAAGVFSPDPISLVATMPAPTTTVQMTIKLEATSQIAGTVYQPDGVTPVGEGVLIKYKSDGVQVFCSETSLGERTCVSIPKGIQELNAVTQADGTFLLPIVTAGPFTLTITDNNVHSARVRGSVRAGERAELSPRLLGVADVIVRVLTSDLKPVPGAKVQISALGDPDRQIPSHDADSTGIARFVGGDGLAEGSFVVLATDLLNGGAAGRASGKVVAEGQTVTVDVYLFTQTGAVSGTVFRADGTPAPNAQVVIANIDGPLTFSVTDANGSYRLDQIPVNKPFTVDVFDPVTAAHGSGTGTIFLPGQEVPVTIHEDALAVVSGTLVDSVGKTPLKGWQVTLIQHTASGASFALITTSGVDGGFSFPGAAVGSFTLLAQKANIQGSAQASGTVDRPGQDVEVTLVATITRPSYGVITGVVLNADGSPAGDAQVDICLDNCSGTFATVAADHTSGEFALPHVPLARVVATGHTQDGLQFGRAVGQITFDGETIRLVVVLAGISQVTGTISFADGRPAANANVTLVLGQTQRQQSADGNGVFTFSNVSARAFTVVATDPVSLLKGAASDLLSAGESKQVQIVLQPTGTVTADVQLENGNVAVGVAGELVIGERHFFAESGPNGTIFFDALPIGDFTLTLQDPVGIGIAKRLGTIAGAVVLGAVRLDSTRPVVASISPSPAATGVPHDAKVKVVFSEPVSEASVSPATIVVSDDTGVVTGTLALTDGDTTATFTPLGNLKDQTKFNVRVSGVRDRVDHEMRGDYTSSFTTADIAPPTVTQFDPAPNSSGVNIYAPIRIAFSEPIDLAKFRAPPSVALTAPDGPVAGRLDFLFGGTVAVFTPNLPLREQTVYHLHAPAAIDLAGNAQPQAVDFDFATTDRTPPTIASLTAANNGRVIENTVTSVVADVGTSHDISFVDFYLNGVFSGTVRAPFSFSFQAVPSLGAPGSTIQVTAIATDTSGNRGVVPASTAVTVTADTPPTVTITPPASGDSAANGQRVDLVVASSDDVGIQKVSFRAKTGNPADAAEHAVSPAALSHSDTFGYNVPNDAIPGSTIETLLTALDTKGQATTATFNVLVLDSIPPAISVSGASSGDKVRPGQQKTIVVSVQDVGGITSVTLKAGGVAALNQTKQIDPPQTSIVTSFMVTVPGSAQPPDSLTIDVSASDRAGNVGTAPRAILPVADNVAPTITAFHTSTNALQIVRGTAVNVVVNAADDIGVSRIDILGQGAFTVTDGQQILPPLVTGTATFAIQVPPDAAPGSVLTLTATAGDLAQNISAPASLALTVTGSSTVTLPPSLLLDAGTAQDVTVQLSAAAPAGGQRIDFASNTTVATVTASITIPAGETTGMVTVTGVATGLTSIEARIDGVVRGSMAATVTGGIVRGTVTDAQFASVANATVAVSDALHTVTVSTDGAGQFLARGLDGPSVTIRAFKDVDQTTRLIGFATAQMNRFRGFAVKDVVLIVAGMIRGTAFAADGQTLAGPGVQVDLFEATNLHDAVATTFTVDQASRFEFPLVAMGQYVVEISQASAGARGRASTAIVASGQEVDLPVAFLGRGTVTITVKDGAGVPVDGANVKLFGFTIFGATDVITRTADVDGRAIFEGVSVGTFRVDASDPVTTRGGSIAGEVASDQQQVAKEITLATYGSIAGTVFRVDGHTTVSGATVSVNGLSTVTDVDGHYAFAYLPLDTLIVTAHEDATRGQGSTTTTLTQQGVTKTVDITLLPQGALFVTVRDANGNPVPGALVTVSVTLGTAFDTISGTTGANGTVLLDHVLAGSFGITARAAGLLGSGNGTLAAGEQQSITVTLQPTASIAGLVTAPNDAPVSEGTVSIDATAFSAAIKVDGTYQIDGLPLASYTLTVRDGNNRIRAHSKTAIQVVVPNQVVQANFKFVGLGSVTGRLLNPDGSSAQGIPVQIRALNPDFGSFAVSTTNAGGFYTATNLAVGGVTVSAANATLHLRAEGAGTIDHDGQLLTIDLLLQNNLTDLPTSRWDANNFLYDIQKDGSLLSGTSKVFGGTSSSNTWGASLLDIVVNGTPTRFTGAPFGTTEDGGHEAAVRQDGVAGLNVTRKVFVPPSGYFARYLEVLANPSDQPITADVLVTSYLSRDVAGGDGATAIVTTSSGDNVLDVSDPTSADRWVVADDVNLGDPFLTLSLPATAFVFDGAGGVQHAGQASVALADPQTTLSPQRLTYGWNAVTIPPGQTIAFMHFTVEQVGRPGAQASAERLVQLPPEALAGLNADETAEVQNFGVPADGLSPLGALPPLTGSVSGRVLGSNGTTAIANSVVRFQSGNLLFGRTYQATSAGDGTFSFSGLLADNGTSRAVPVDGFTLQADHPQAPSLIKSPVTNGQFADGSLLAQQDVAFSNTGIVHGFVLLNGTPVNGVQVSASGAVGETGFTFTTTTGPDGSFTFPLLPVGQITVSATASLPLGGTKTGASVATVVGGQTIEAPIGIDTIAPQITITSPAPNAAIDPQLPMTVTVSAIDQGGVAQITLQATGATTFAETRAVSPTAGTATELFSVPFATLPATGGSVTLSATARDAGGNQGSASPVTVSIRDVVAPTITSIVPASGSVDVEPTASIVVQFSEAVARASITGASLSLTLNGSAVPVTFAFNDNDRSVTLMPTQALALNRTYTIGVTTAVTDVAGNGLASPASLSFKTKSPDTTSPRVSTLVPANGAVNVPVGAAVDVTFTEPVDRATISAASFRVTVTGTPVAGHFTFASNDAEVTFVPDAPLPFDSLAVVELSPAITDLFQNPLADAAGNPLTAPLIFTFATGTFGITSPAQGAQVLENATLTLQADASSSLGIATVAFTVNGQALTPVSGPPFATTFNVGSAASTPTLTVLAIGLNAGSTEVARDQVVVPVVAGLRAGRSLLGVPLGGSARLRLFIPSSLATNLSIQLAAVDPAIASAPATAMIAAGQTETFVDINGVAVGATTITATSSRGIAWTIASVSQPISKSISVNAAPTLVVTTPGQSLGRAFVGPAAVESLSLRLLSSAAAADTAVTVTSSNPAVATVNGAVSVAAGSTTAIVPVTTGVVGTATLTFGIGNVTTQLTVVVGPPFNDVSPAAAPPVGVVVLTPPSLGRVFTPLAAQSGFTLQLLSSPAATATPVSVTSSNAAIAQVIGSVAIPAGSQSAPVTIETGTAGIATLTFVAGSEMRVLTVIVGAAAGSIPPINARPVEFVWLPPLSAGRVFTPVTGQMTVSVRLLSAPASTLTTATVSSSDPGVATVAGAVVIATGAQDATVNLQTGSQGTATITFVAAGERRELTVIVGTPPANLLPVVSARPVGLVVLPMAQSGTVFSAVVGNAAVNVPLLSAPASAPVPVTVTTSDASVANVSNTPVIGVGSQSATLDIVTGGQGVATLTVSAGGTTTQVVVVVGTPPPGMVPTIKAPIVGVQVKP